jgi:DNA-binding NtrC family response regulator
MMCVISFVPRLLQAIHIARTFEGDIDVTLLDIVLPDMEGKNLYPLPMEARPNMKVIICSGFAIDGPAQAILNEGAQDFIRTLSLKLKKLINGVGS